MTQTDRPFLGILLMLGFCVMAPMGDAIAKLLSSVIPLFQLLLVRFAVQALLLWPVTWAGHRPWRMSPQVTGLALVRAVLHIFGIAMMFSALYYLPLADAVAIAFVMPFIMLLLGAWVLNEEVGPRRIIACAVGFAGTLLVVQPSFASVGWPALLPLGVAVVFALFMLVTRAIARRTDPIALQAVNGTMAIALLLPLAIWGWRGGPVALQWLRPDATQWLLLLTIGALGTLAHLLMTWSLRYAPAATLAPMQYLEIPFATLIGWLIFRDLPNGLAALGICITMGAGLYIILRERANAAPPARPVPPPPDT